nr:myosin-9-like isoform X2 [Cherax quadricarinatus]
MDGDDSVIEDEWVGLRRRFTIEGLEWETLEPSSQTLHVWRWVVDAEANLKTARHINDKLRRQHDEEKVELDEYTQHIRARCEERVKELDDEVRNLREDLESLLAGTQAVTSLLLKEGLEDVAQSSLGEQIAYLLVERLKMNEELVAARTNPVSSRERELTTQLIKASTELELLKRTHQDVVCQMAEMSDRVTLLEKASRQLELDNETLAYKLSEALAEIEENEGQLRRYAKNTNFRRGESPCTSLRSHEEYGPPSFVSLPPSECVVIHGDSQRMGIHRRESSRSSGRRKIIEPLRAERGKSPRNSQRRQHSSKLRGVGGDGGKSNEAVQNDGELALSSLGKDHVIASLGSASPKKLHSLFDEQIQSSRNRISMLEEIRKLQSELENIKKDLIEAGDRYELIVRKYEVYKIKSKNKVYSVRSAYQSELDTLKRRINKLEAEVALQGDQLQAEESLRKQLDEDLSSIRTERQELAMRVRESERIANDHRQEVKLLQEKVRLIQSMNQELSEKLQELSVAAIVG